jgi:hypothetical protein
MGLLESRFEINSLVSSAIKIPAHSGPQKHHLRSLGPEAPEATDFEAQLSPLANDVLPQEGRRGCAIVPSANRSSPSSRPTRDGEHGASRRCCAASSSCRPFSKGHGMRELDRHVVKIS